MNPLLNSVVLPLLACYDEREANALARYVLEVRFGITLTALCADKDIQISAEERSELQNIVCRLLQKEPVQYVLQQADFMGRTFRTVPGVLIPRPETEELVQWVVSDHAGTAPPRILDIGTGSGCIAITLSRELPGAGVTAIDISPQALKTAAENAAAHHADVTFAEHDILQPDVPDPLRHCDIIVSNPPYICRREAADMDDNVLRYEPELALFVPDDRPLLFYEAIARFARQALRPQGCLYLEINRSYGPETAGLLRREGFRDIELRKDFYGNDRMIKCRK